MSGFHERTRVWCFTCKAEHPAEAFEADGAVQCRCLPRGVSSSRFCM